MAYKRITLKDPVTGDFLIPSTGGLEYIPTPEGAVPPFELVKDADTLQGHTADEFVKLADGSSATKGQVLMMGESAWEPKTMVDDSVVEAFGATTLNEALAKLSSAVVYNPTAGIKYHIGENWELKDFSYNTLNSMYCFLVHDNIFIMSKNGTQTTLLVSFDGGNTFTERSTSNNMQAIAYFKGRVVAVTVKGEVYEVTESAITLLTTLTSFGSSYEPIIAAGENKLFIAARNSTGNNSNAYVWSTEDLVNWTTLNVTKPSNYFSIIDMCCLSNDRFSITWTYVRADVFIYDSNGTSLAQFTAYSDVGYYRLCYNYDRDELLCLPTGSNSSSAPLVIYNTANYTQITSISRPGSCSLSYTNIIYIDNNYYISGSTGIVKLSYNASTAVSVYTGDLRRIVYDDTKRALIVGVNGNQLLYSTEVAQPALLDLIGNLISIPSNQINEQLRIATGSYTGTGTYGASNKTSLTFDFQPSVIFIGATTNSNRYAEVGVIIAKVAGYKIKGGQYGIISSVTGNTVSFYAEADASNQFNTSEITYHYIAIG